MIKQLIKRKEAMRYMFALWMPKPIGCSDIDIQKAGLVYVINSFSTKIDIVVKFTSFINKCV